jgi:Zn-dependent protease
MDRAGIVMDQYGDGRPIHPQGSLRRTLERIGGIAVVIGGTALKWGFVFAKFFGFFISVAAYTLWFHSWTFAFGFVLMILVHELGHVAESRRQGLRVSWPTFVPFLGAFVTIERAGLTPWKNALISLAGPLAGGGAAFVVWALAGIEGSRQLEVLANIGFLLNAFNMLPIGFLDGGQVVRAAREEWRMPRIVFEDGVPVDVFKPDRGRAVTIGVLYVAIAVVLVLGLLATRPNGAL